MTDERMEAESYHFSTDKTKRALVWCVRYKNIEGWGMSEDEAYASWKRNYERALAKGELRS